MMLSPPASSRIAVLTHGTSVLKTPKMLCSSPGAICLLVELSVGLRRR